MNKIILLAHGSPDPRSGAAIRRFSIKVQNCISLPTQVAFLDHEKPSLFDIVESGDANEILVVPMLLSNAFHARFDVPKAMVEAGLTRVLPPIGHPREILTSLIQNAGSNVIVAAAGTSDRGARQLFAEAVEIASLGLGIHTRHAFVTGTGPDLQTQILLAQGSDSGEVTIIPWLLAEGRLLDNILSNSKKYGAVVKGSGLVDESIFVDQVTSSITISLQSEPYLV